MLKKIPGDFKMRDLLELLKLFKSKGSSLFVNFYKQKKKKIEEGLKNLMIIMKMIMQKERQKKIQMKIN